MWPGSNACLTIYISLQARLCAFDICYTCSFEERPLPTECAVKVFKTTLNEFKNRDRYIKDDYRFKARFRKQNPRKVVRMWAEKEMHNLKRCAKIAQKNCVYVVYTD